MYAQCTTNLSFLLFSYFKAYKILMKKSKNGTLYGHEYRLCTTTTLDLSICILLLKTGCQILNSETDILFIPFKNWSLTISAFKQF